MPSMIRTKRRRFASLPSGADISPHARVLSGVAGASSASSSPSSASGSACFGRSRASAVSPRKEKPSSRRASTFPMPGSSRVRFSTAPLLLLATTTRWSSSRLSRACTGPAWVVQVPRSNASAGSRNVESTAARRATTVAIRSISSVVFPVPGGPFTARMPPPAKSATARSTASCCISDMLWPDGQRARGCVAAVQAEATKSRSVQSIRPAVPARKRSTRPPLPLRTARSTRRRSSKKKLSTGGIAARRCRSLRIATGLPSASRSVGDSATTNTAETTERMIAIGRVGGTPSSQLSVSAVTPRTAAINASSTWRSAPLYASTISSKVARALRRNASISSSKATGESPRRRSKARPNAGRRRLPGTAMPSSATSNTPANPNRVTVGAGAVSWSSSGSVASARTMSAW